MSASPNLSNTQKNTTKEYDNPVYILITQCLQNAFFLDDESRLCLPENEAIRILVGSNKTLKAEISEKGEEKWWINSRQGAINENRRVIPEKLYKNGPLYLFFEAITQNRKSPLHIINIKDWHQPSASYDYERRTYGAHCEANTWSAKGIDGFEKFLEPPVNLTTISTLHNQIKALEAEYEKNRQNHSESHPIDSTQTDEEVKQLKDKIQRIEDEIAARKHEDRIIYTDGNITYYEVRSDSVFDFKPPYNMRQVETIPNTPSPEMHFDYNKPSALTDILSDLINPNDDRQHVYLGVIGVYTDIKVQLLLAGLRSRYPIDNLVISDVLTASPTLERHLSALDFAAKVLNVEVIHGLNDFARFLNPSYLDKTLQTEAIPQSLLENSVIYRNYSSYFLDKQNMLSYQDQKVIEYLELTRRRATRVYRLILWTSMGLMAFGFAFLLVTLIAAIVGTFNEDQVSIEFLAAIGAISLASLVSVFILQPIAQIQKNLNNLVQLRTIIESHSLVQALMRHHFSTPERLYPPTKAETAEVRESWLKSETEFLKNLESQIKMVQTTAQIHSEMLADMAKRDISDSTSNPTGTS